MVLPKRLSNQIDLMCWVLNQVAVGWCNKWSNLTFFNALLASLFLIRAYIITLKGKRHIHTLHQISFIFFTNKTPPRWFIFHYCGGYFSLIIIKSQLLGALSLNVTDSNQRMYLYPMTSGIPVIFLLKSSPSRLKNLFHI